MTRPTFWDQEHSDFLISNWEHQSAAWIAAQLGTTKNAVIGRANRRGLRKRQSEVPPPPPPPPELSAADFHGCRYVIGETTPARTGMYCCLPVVTKLIEGNQVPTAWCPKHYKIAYKSPATRWTPDRRAAQANAMRRRRLHSSAPSPG